MNIFFSAINKLINLTNLTIKSTFELTFFLLKVRKLRNLVLNCQMF